MAPSKTNKIKKVRHLEKLLFSYTTLPFGQKRFVHFKGPKNVLCHGLTQRQEIQIFHSVRQRNFLTAEVRDIFRFLFTKIFLVFDFGHFLFLIICQFSPQWEPLNSEEGINDTDEDLEGWTDRREA